MIFREEELIFRGSKERLKRNIRKQGGDFPSPGTFRLLWRSAYFRRGLAFRMDGSYEKAEEGYRIRYRFVPTPVTVLWVFVPMLLLWYYVFWDIRAGGGEGAAAVALFSGLYPAIALWQYRSCRKSVERFFSVTTQ